MVGISVGDFTFTPEDRAFKLVHCSGLEKWGVDLCRSMNLNPRKQTCLREVICLGRDMSLSVSASLSLCLSSVTLSLLFVFPFLSPCLHFPPFLLLFLRLCISVSLSLFLFLLCLLKSLYVCLCFPVCIFLSLPFRVSLWHCVSLWLERDYCGTMGTCWEWMW